MLTALLKEGDIMTKSEKFFELVKMEMYPKKLPFNSVLTEMSPMEFCAIGTFVEFEKQNSGRHITVNELSQESGMSVPLVSRTLKNLESRGLIKRITDENCRRNTLVVISEKGNKLFEQNTKVIMNYLEKVLDYFTDSEIEMLISLKKKSTDAMEKVIKEFIAQ